MCILLESPGPEEPTFLVRDLMQGEFEESNRRHERYPFLEEKYCKIGAPVVGRSGQLLWRWLMQPMGLQRSDVAIFNTICCLPPRGAKGEFQYPKGAVRKRAEATCAQTWMQPLMEWDPEVAVVAMHPSALSRDIVPLPVVLRAIERAKKFALAGRRVLLLMGGKAAHHWLGYAENTTKWTCHYQEETLWTRVRREARWERNRGLKVGKEPRKKKLTVKAALALLLSEFKCVTEVDETAEGGSKTVYRYAGPSISPVLYDAMKVLTAPAKKRSKKLEPTVAEVEMAQ